MFFEAKLCRFGVWRAVVFSVGALAISAETAWAAAMLAAEPERAATLIVPVAALLGVASFWAVWSLARVKGGVLSCREGIWTFVPDAGRARSGTLEVAIDVGTFLLLRLGRAGAGSWLPVQRRGLEAQWHALRCAVYTPLPRTADGPAAGSGPPSRSGSG